MSPLQKVKESARRQVVASAHRKWRRITAGLGSGDFGRTIKSFLLSMVG
jgi:hypothetical protein